jgi:Ser/Thr protein kinase RdoA (MazF antagonist)
MPEPQEVAPLLNADPPPRLCDMSNGEVEPLDPHALPRAIMWERLGLVPIRQVSGGHQSRVFIAQTTRGRVVVKLTDERFVDLPRFERGLEMLVDLARQDDHAVGPQLHNGEYLNRLDGWLAVVYPFVTGVMPNVERDGDVVTMGRTLARLHRSMSRLPTFELPAVAGFEFAQVAMPESPPVQIQLIHGDFAAANLRLQAGRVRVFDFDDCGSGSLEFEVANTLYMVLFDSTINGNPATYERFRRQFVDSYRTESGKPVDDGILDSMIDLRRDALRYWLTNLDDAPIGIKTSSPEWRMTLRSFVEFTGR